MITSPFGWAGPHGGTTERDVFAFKIARHSALHVLPPLLFRISAVLDSCPADGVGAVVFALSFFGAWFGGAVATGLPATMSPPPHRGPSERLGIQGIACITRCCTAAFPSVFPFGLSGLARAFRVNIGAGIAVRPIIRGVIVNVLTFGGAAVARAGLCIRSLDSMLFSGRARHGSIVQRKDNGSA